MDFINTLKNIADSNGGLIEVSIAEKNGVSRAMLSKLCQRGAIERIARGQYVFPDNIDDELYFLSQRSNNIIFSHETALFLNGISDRTPFEHTITVPSNKAPSQYIKSQCKIYYIKPELFDLGRTEIKTPAGNTVSCYDLERTICDIVRNRKQIGSETFIAALKMYASTHHKNLHKLNDYAKQLGLSNVIYQYMEVLL